MSAPPYPKRLIEVDLPIREISAHARRPPPLLIVNPASGGGRTGEAFSAMLPAIERALGAVEVAKTERRGHAMELARDAADGGRELVIAVGGDGTLSDVVNGVMQSKARGEASTRVGMIAQGTGGDFRRTMGLEHRLDRYLAALKEGRSRPIDVGRMRYREDGESKEHYFVNILSAGMGGLVDRYVSQGRGMFGGTVKYFGASLRALANCAEGVVRCTYRESPDGELIEKRLSTYMIAVCNGRYFGSGMHVAPMATIDDGLFDVVSIGAGSKLAFAVAARKIYSGTHLGEHGVEHFRCVSIDLEIENESARSVFLLDCDGEPMGPLPVSIDVLRNAIRLQV